MSWVDRLLPRIRKSDNKEENKSKKENAIPEGLWTKCTNCEQVLYTEELQSSLNVCPKCGHHMRLSARQRVEWFLDAQDQVELTQEVVAADPLKFVDSHPYPARVAAAQRKSKETDALVVKRGTLRGLPVVVAAFEFGFMGGSMGSVVGERFVRGVAEATRLRCPFICFAASGGARMQEGLLSLMQMAKTTAAIAAFSEEKLPFISVLTDPTMGGVSASFAFVGDVVIAEPKALVGFAGPRVIEQTVREKLPDGFQRAEFLLKKGAINMIVDRRKMRGTISELTALLMKKRITHYD